MMMAMVMAIITLNSAGSLMPSPSVPMIIPEECTVSDPTKAATDAAQPSTVVPSGATPNQQPWICALVASCTKARQ